MDARGINKDSTQQKLAEVGQVMKDYGAVGQQRAGEYFNQAVDQVRLLPAAVKSATLKILSLHRLQHRLKRRFYES